MPSTITEQGKEALRADDDPGTVPAAAIASGGSTRAVTAVSAGRAFPA